MEFKAGIIDRESSFGVSLVVICTITSVSMALSNIPTVWKIYKEKSVGVLPVLPFLSLFVTALSYGLYGLVSGDITCILTLISATLGFCYTVIYGFYVSKNQRCWFLFQVLCTAIIAMVQIYLLVRDNQKWLSINTQILCAVLYFSPLVAFHHVCKTKSTEAMPLPLSLMSFCSSFSWAFYGYFVIDDVTLWGVCSVGVLFSCAQLALIALYRGNKPIEEAGKPEINKESPIYLV